MDTADDIAYAIHDVEDFYRVGVLQQGSVSAELMAWQRESGHLQAITDAALATAARRPGAAIERLRRQLHRKDAWIADDDAFAAAVEHVREELVDGLLAMPFDGSIEAEQYVSRFSARWSTRFVEAITVTDQPSVRSGYVLLGCAQWHEVQVLKFVHHRFVLARPDLALHQRGQARLLGTLVEALWEWLLDPEEESRLPRRLHDWSSWPRPSCTRVHRTGSAGPEAAPSWTSSRSSPTARRSRCWTRSPAAPARSGPTPSCSEVKGRAPC